MSSQSMELQTKSGMRERICLEFGSCGSGSLQMLQVLSVDPALLPGAGERRADR